MAAPRQGLPVRLDRAPQRGAAFALTRASRRARMRSPSRTGTDFMGTVGLDWQASGVGNFSSISGESDMILRNVNTGGLELYNIAHNQITGSAFLGHGRAGLAVRWHRPGPWPRHI
jgi:hypothetical protein